MPSYNTFPQFPILTGPRAGFPTALKWPITKTPNFKTMVSEAASGKEYRYPNQQSPRWKFKLDFGYLFDDVNVPNAVYQNMAQTLQGFFLQQQGSYLPFLYVDPWDSASGPSGTVTIAIGDGASTAFQVIRLLGSPSLPAVGAEAVQWLTGSNTFLVNGSPAAHTISEPPVVVTFSSPPASGAVVTWSGSFAFLCRFTQDKFDFVHERQGYWTTGLEFETILA